MQSILIISPNKTDRENFAIQLCDNYYIDPLDRIFLTIEGTIGIEDVRKLQQSLQLKPLRGQDKAAIITDSHTLTPEAQNAFLKTLEEPPDNTYILLLAETDTAFLPTILSRCKVITLTGEVKTYSAEDREKAIKTLQEILSGSIDNRLYYAQLWGEKKETALEWLESIIVYSREKLVQSSDKRNESVQTILVLEQLQETYRIIKTTNVNPRFALESLFLNINPFSS